MSQLSNNSPQYDLEERTAQFGENIIDFLKTIKINPINKRMVEQLVGSGGSVGAHYAEASEAESKKDFIHKISIGKKELKETKHWLRLLSRTNPEQKENIKTHYRETHELLLIFAKIVHSARNKK